MVELPSYALYKSVGSQLQHAYHISFCTPISKLISVPAADATLLMALPRIDFARLSAVSAISGYAPNNAARSSPRSHSVAERMSTCTELPLNEKPGTMPHREGKKKYIMH